MSELSLKANPTLKDLQEYAAAMAVVRKFENEPASHTLLFLTEEVGELAKAVRKHTGLKVAPDYTANLEHEAADVLIVLLCLCNTLGVDLEAAFRAKEEHNKQRTWV